jgi:TFIIF-interacting CTD phosphatase-like protein
VIEEDERIYGDGENINPLIEGLDEEGERIMKKISICFISLAFIISVTFSNSAFAAGKTLRIAMLLWRGETKAERIKN